MQDFVYSTTLERGLTFLRSFVSRQIVGQSATSLLIALGSHTFQTQSGLSISVGQRVHISSKAEPLNFFEGAVTAYAGTGLTVNVDLISGDTTTEYVDWILSVSDDFTGDTLASKMRLVPEESCAAKSRNATILTASIDGDPTTGKFSISLTPAQTLALSLGTYSFDVVLIYDGGADKRRLVRGTIQVVDPDTR